MKVRIIFKSKHDGCVEYCNVLNVIDSDDFIFINYIFKNIKIVHPILKRKIKYVKVIPGKEEF